MIVDSVGLSELAALCVIIGSFILIYRTLLTLMFCFNHYVYIIIIYKYYFNITVDNHDTMS